MTTQEVQALRDLFAKRLKKLLDERNMDQIDLSAALGLDRSTVNKWATANALPRAGTTEKIAAFFGVKKSYLLDESGSDERSYYLDPAAAKMAQELYDNPDMRILFDAAKNVSADDLKLVAEMMLRMKKKENHEDD